MQLKKYIEEKKQLQRSLLTFIDQDDTKNEENYENLLQLIQLQKIAQSKEELTAFFHLISQISANHHRTQNFHSKIDRIISIFENEIKENFLNMELFHIFQRNKRIILYLIQNNLIFLDENVAKLLSKPKYYKLRYIHYFYPELKKYLTDETLKKEIEKDISKFNDNTFRQLREQGENEQKICEIIRNDFIYDFTSQVTPAQIHHLPNIATSVFETNTFLIKNKTSLIEYAAFFGSIQIFKYLLENNGQISPEIWLFAIHGANLEIIKILEEHKARSNDRSFVHALDESFKCHHGEVTKYLLENLVKFRYGRESSDLSRSTKYYNYEFFPADLNNQFTFCNLCQADYFSVVNDLVNLSKKNFKINEPVSSI